LTLSTSVSKPPAGELGQQHQDEQGHDQHHPERRQLDILPILPQLPDHDRHHLGARRIEQDRARQLADRDDHHVDEAGEQPRLEQRQDDAAEGHAPGGAAHGGRLLELLVDLQHRGRGVAHAVRQKAGDVGDQDDPERAVDADVDVQVADHDRQPEHQAGEHQRQRGEVVEHPAPRHLGAHDDPRDHRGGEHDHGGAADRQHQAVPDAAGKLRIVEHRAVGIEADAAERLERGRAVEFLQRRPEQDQERQQHDDDEIEDEDRGGEIAPFAEIDGARPEALAGHGGEP
jgi:hypothetical protein